MVLGMFSDRDDRSSLRAHLDRLRWIWKCGDISVTETMKTMVCLYNGSLLLNTENMVRTY